MWFTLEVSRTPCAVSSPSPLQPPACPHAYARACAVHSPSEWWTTVSLEPELTPQALVDDETKKTRYSVLKSAATIALLSIAVGAVAATAGAALLPETAVAGGVSTVHQIPCVSPVPPRPAADIPGRRSRDSGHLPRQRHDSDQSRPDQKLRDDCENLSVDGGPPLYLDMWLIRSLGGPAEGNRQDLRRDRRFDCLAARGYVPAPFLPVFCD